MENKFDIEKKLEMLFIEIETLEFDYPAAILK